MVATCYQKIATNKQSKMTNHWIEVETILPNVGDSVLIYPAVCGDVSIGIVLPSGTWLDQLVNEKAEVTHWRPLPNKPKI
jgi:Protein of unknown function (DUF551)